jgi:hypothetical protein
MEITPRALCFLGNHLPLSYPPDFILITYHWAIPRVYLKIYFYAEEMAQKLRALADSPVSPASVSNTHTVAHNNL